MPLAELPILGAYVLDPVRTRDARGSFVRSWTRADFESRGFEGPRVYLAYAHNTSARTLRGMHVQRSPYGEHKIVSCPRGAIWDVIVDMRIGSATFGRWHAERLDGESLRSILVPPGLAHGYLTLQDDTLVAYELTPDYHPDAASGFRYDDPTVGIAWPGVPKLVSDADASLPPFEGLIEW